MDVCLLRAIPGGGGPGTSKYISPLADRKELGKLVLEAFVDQSQKTIVVSEGSKATSGLGYLKNQDDGTSCYLRDTIGGGGGVGGGGVGGVCDKDGPIPFPLPCRVPPFRMS
ncbi:hypothetical protein Ancab_039387 [Ancistrocladus abbreviatus]